jgi:KRAB domain-containing zinc finger protein
MSDDKKPCRCKECGKGFMYGHQLETHINCYHIPSDGTGPLKCEQCGKGFFNKRSIMLHLRVHAIDRPYKCIECGKSFTQDSTLRSHIRTHTGEKPHKCDICGQGFSTYASRNKHKTRFHDKNKFTCEICRSVIVGTKAYKIHQRQHRLSESQGNGTLGRVYTCRKCGKKCHAPSRLKEHMITHMKRQPFKCTYPDCPRRFGRQNNLKRHLECHNKLRLIKFTTKNGVKSVVRFSKDKNRPFLCSFCSCRFIKERDLETHIKCIHDVNTK